MNALLGATRRNQGAVFAAALFAVLFVGFLILHPRGLSIMVTTPAANQGLALAFAAMAQTLPVTNGRTRSFGRIGACTQQLCCLASGQRFDRADRWRHRGDTARRRRLRIFQRRGRRRWKDPTDYRDAGDRCDLHRDRVPAAPNPGRQHRRGSRRPADQRNLRRDPDFPAAACRRLAGGVGAIPQFGARAWRLRRRIVGGRGVPVGRAGGTLAAGGLHAGGVASGLRRAVPGAADTCRAMRRWAPTIP